MGKENFDRVPYDGMLVGLMLNIRLIGFRLYESARKLTRVEFVCGGRTLAEYRLAKDTAFAVARLFSSDRENAPELVAAAIQEHKGLKKRIRDLLELAMSAEAAEILGLAPALQNFKLVQSAF